MIKLGSTDLQVFPLCLGGNVFGWTADEAASFEVLDAYAAAGGNFVDTADMYSEWVPGNVGGESEAILGRWMASRENRASIVVATKVGKLSTLEGLSAKTIRAAAEASLKRLGTDHIDLYYAHADDEKTPLDETLRAFDALVREGKVRHVAASNYSAPRLAEALAISKRENLARYEVLQPHYNLVHRDEFEGELSALCVREDVAVAPYYALASGFLTGKYRPGAKVESPRSSGPLALLETAKGKHVLEALDAIAAAHRTTVSAVALAWLATRPAVATPIASARTVEQLREVLPVATLALERAELVQLDQAGR